ncbi:MAG: hypothetical protein WCR42_11390 [bacterium]
MKKTLKNITAYMILAIVLLSSGSFQMRFMHCSKTNLTKISPLMSIRTQEIKHNDELSECPKCRKEQSCKADKSCQKNNNQNTDISNGINFKDACCVNYHILYKNDLTSEAPVKINSPEIEFPTLIIHEGFNIFKSEDKLKYNSADFADISPPTIIKQIIKSIRQKSITSPDEAIC